MTSSLTSLMCHFFTGKKMMKSLAQKPSNFYKATQQKPSFEFTYTYKKTLKPKFLIRQTYLM